MPRFRPCLDCLGMCQSLLTCPLMKACALMKAFGWGDFGPPPFGSCSCLLDCFEVQARRQSLFSRWSRSPLLLLTRAVVSSLGDLCFSCTPIFQPVLTILLPVLGSRAFPAPFGWARVTRPGLLGRATWVTFLGLCACAFGLRRGLKL